ncbi:mothers against decapentaplegic homolog 6 [Onthophagus taurus]|uniref:mothers against decapentaplegic homolog 6 n=1 Tax=Onthophagus taurus TaxID=166361 RepID=UPI000C20EF59|nr:mothers against decapentaplegic homolog 6 [Onthophagus taurus]
MFKFRRKTALVKKLLKEASRPANGPSDEGLCYQKLAALLRKLNANQLEMLHQVVTTKGKGNFGCVLVENDGIVEDPHLLCCKSWRWSDDWRRDEIRRLPVCGSARDKVYVCINPYHLSKLCIPDSIPPPYSCLDHINPEDRAQIDSRLVFRDSYAESLTTNGENSSSRNYWCQLAYWERRKRVGRLFPVELPYVNIFWDVPYGDGISIKELSRDNTDADMVKARQKIGLGITVSREPTGIWVYNRSSVPIFVNSITLRDEKSSSPIRVPDQQCLCVFDVDRASRMVDFANNSMDTMDGPIDRNSITISFGKGWGLNYSRMEISSCPCWIEILLAPCR